MRSQVSNCSRWSRGRDQDGGFTIWDQHGVRGMGIGWEGQHGIRDTGIGCLASPKMCGDA